MTNDNQLWNGLSWESWCSANAANASLSGIAAVNNLVFDTTVGQYLRSLSAKSLVAGGVDGTHIPAVGLVGYNGSSFQGFKTNTAGPTTDFRQAVSPGTGQFLSLNAITSAASGASVNFGTAVNNVGVQLSSTSAPTGMSVALQASLDGSNWNQVGAPITSIIFPIMVFFTNNPSIYWRLVCSSLTGGSSPNVSGLLVGY